ncbi:MAG: hypothetical protein CM1200mP3_16600 [Chloroflexota bacterium]|nr:MAG: hypothetical protein CM1200mP3_16600 [Chloroflexota bacterium]
MYPVLLQCSKTRMHNRERRNSSHVQQALRVSYGEYVYENVPGWAPLPDGWEWNHVVGVAVDRETIYSHTTEVTIP